MPTLIECSTLRQSTQHTETVAADSHTAMATACATTVVAEEPKKDHIIIVPFMAKGHIIPLLHLAAALSGRGLYVTIITTPSNAPFIRRHLPACRYPLVTVHSLPFPLFSPLPPGVESTDALPSPDLYSTFHRAAVLLADPFSRLLRQIVEGGVTSPPRPLCLISDFLLWWTVPPCLELGLPRLVFHGMSVFSMVLCRFMGCHRPFDGGAETFHVPGTPPSILLSQTDVPQEVRDLDKPNKASIPFMDVIGSTDVSSWGVLVNSFSEIDTGYFTELLESTYQSSTRAWLVGPLCLFPTADVCDAKSDPEGYLQWLDEKPRDSVVYVSFGTQAQLSDAQLDEVAHGLAESGYEFLIVTRSSTWRAPLDLASTGSKVVRRWVPQEALLRHSAVGCFVSHCGWNSVLESLAAGVPILAFPMMAEQALNARHVAEVLGAGLSLGSRLPGEIVGREEVAEGVRRMMGGGEQWAGQARERAAEIQRAAEEAVAEGGSSQVALQELLMKLREIRAGKETT
ncbi:UDP-glycosyltransferase 73B4-like [Canna indica]|uniref:Glycosyltransferase n=1 Tax=Canna indica TaxID=4628 RepID=A0AAQ3JS93_9LILI|nr:UDP-glycosyltransferase 73B4-like [Canna indica]